MPGPTVALIAANSLRNGFAAGFAAVVGTQVGYLLWLAVGIFALGFVSADSRAVTVLRLAGAAYLAWLAIKLYRARGTFWGDETKLADKPWVQGFFVILVNPKMLVLFCSLIPQFVKGSLPSRLEVLWLGLVFMLISTFGDLAYAYAFAKLRDRVSTEHECWLETAGALCLLAGAVWLVSRVVMAAV